MKNFSVSALSKAGLVVLGAACLPAFAGPVDNAYELNVQAMQDVNHKTDVYVTLKPSNSSVVPASSIKHLQMKSLDVAGVERWTKNEMDVAAQVASSGKSSVTRAYTDMQRYQVAQAQLNVQTAQSIKTQVLKTSAPVLYRPDLTVASIAAEQTVRVGQVVNIAATVKELNGDLAANTTLRLKQGSTQLDQVSGVYVAKRGSTQAVFATRFSQPGTYVLTVAADEANPGDFDLSNNSKDVTIKVVNDVKPADYSMYYYYVNGTYGWDYSNWYGSGRYSFAGETQNFSLNLSSGTEQLTFPITRATIQLSLDGGQTVINKEVTNLAGNSYSDQWGCYRTTQGAQEVAPGMWMYITSVDYCGQKYSYASFNQYASDYLYYSQYYDYYWGGYSSGSTATVKSGTVLRAKTSIDARMVVTSANGTSIGGNARMLLTQTPNVYDYTSNYGGGYDRSWGNYVYTQGYSNGVTQP